MSKVVFETADLPEAKFEKGHALIEEGKPGAKVYVLKSGVVSVVAGGNVLARVSEPMTMFGEMSLLIDTKATANVIVEEPSTFYVIDDLMAYLITHPQSGIHIAQVLARRLVDMNKYYVQIKSEIVRIESNPATKASKALGHHHQARHLLGPRSTLSQTACSRSEPIVQ